MNVLAALMLAQWPLVAAITQPTSQPHAVAHVQPSPALFALPVIARVHVDVSKERVVLVHEIVIARGEWSGGDVDLWVSFGPTMPRALDAHLLSIHAGSAFPDPADVGEPLALDKAAHRPARAYALLGRSSMAGVVLHVREPAFRRAVAASGVLAVRVRQVLAPPDEDEHHARELVVRLGMESGTPLTVRHITLSTPEPAGFVASASAQLCGPDEGASTYILGFQSAPPGARLTPFAIDPASATRHASDDLCVRWVTP